MKDTALVWFSVKQALGQLGMWKVYGSITSMEGKGREMSDPEADTTKSTGKHGVPVTQAPCWGLILSPCITALHGHCQGQLRGVTWAGKRG